MNLIITAGGTRERIDAVRTITNDSTGRLGSLIAAEFLRRFATQSHTIYYLCGVGSIIPDVEDPDIHIIRIEGTDQLQHEMSKLLSGQHISAVIHSMAVSDYRIKCVTTPEAIARDVVQRNSYSSRSTTCEDWRNMIVEAFVEQPNKAEQKISSELEHPVLVLEKTPKIIDMIKKISPHTVLVGFKLLSGVSEDNLIETGYNLLLRNKCNFVLANDMDSIRKGNHEGYLIDADANYIKFVSKEHIAIGIVDNVLKEIEEDAN